ncbi:hypothetical protein SAMN05444678_1192 [Sphingomonas sp. YR710]|uniref:hypothetical protein n=1 Tax=Sphingomonas sp. YR710 TaxID=1882773 RepID=UPI00088E62B0|nr:hypothetical protein [Sphingomonas sp. YR710]SDD67884.1 hypothetical protein SAMN05444678_1192 [Sphingomonas sp. YR710]
MTTNSLDRFVAGVAAAWGPLDSALAARCRQMMAELTLAPTGEPWLDSLHRDRPVSRELHRDGERGFMLLAHAEQSGLYRPPHDHGRSWVVYGVQSGELEVATYARIASPDGTVRLVRREMHVLRPGDARAYLPGDIHDTRCLSSEAMLLRFTERDLRDDNSIVRYVEQDGEWLAPSQ